jgi:hypothetical protein
MKLKEELLRITACFEHSIDYALCGGLAVVVHGEFAKSQSRGVSCDMTADAILRRLDIVDELRELARDLQNAKRLGSVKLEKPTPSPAIPTIRAR